MKRKSHQVIKSNLTHCPECYYSLEGLPENHTCPECGTRYDENCKVYAYDKRPILFPVLLNLVIQPIVFGAVIFKGNPSRLAIVLYSITLVGLIVFITLLYFHRKKTSRQDKLMKYDLAVTVDRLYVRNQSMVTKIDWSNIAKVFHDNNSIQQNAGLQVQRIRERDFVSLPFIISSEEEQKLFFADANRRIEAAKQ